MIGKTKGISQKELKKASEQLFCVNQSWISVFSHLYKLDESSNSEREVILKLEVAMMDDWYILVKEISELSKIMYAALSLVSASKT